MPRPRSLNKLPMFLRLVSDSFARRPRHKLLTGAALALGMAVATAALSVAVDVGDRLAREFRSLGANLLVTPEADSLPLEIGGVDYRPVNAGAYIPEADLRKLKTIFWHNNIVGFAPILEVPIKARNLDFVSETSSHTSSSEVRMIGTWSNHQVQIPDGSIYVTGIEKTNPWWHVGGRWFAENKPECVVGTRLAKRLGVSVGGELMVFQAIKEATPTSSTHLAVVGLLETGGSGEDLIVSPLSGGQALSDKPGQYRQLDVKSLTKPENSFAREAPKGLRPVQFSRGDSPPDTFGTALHTQQDV